MGNHCFCLALDGTAHATVARLRPGGYSRYKRQNDEDNSYPLEMYTTIFHWLTARGESPCGAAPNLRNKVLFISGSLPYN